MSGLAVGEFPTIPASGVSEGNARTQCAAESGPDSATDVASQRATQALSRAEWQSVVFGLEPSRLDLLALKPSWPLRSLRVVVYRNSGVELFTPLLSRFLAYAGYDADFSIGPYDDSLSFEAASQADLDLVWLDPERYRLRDGDFVEWLLGRFRFRRSIVDRPILLAALPGVLDSAVQAALDAAISELAGVVTLPLAELQARLGEAFYDRDAARFTGSPLSNRAAIEIARALGLVWMPPVLQPRIKAIAVDLDGTLYGGVLGEDGADGIRAAAGHVAVQRTLKSLSEAGVMLGMISKNDPTDVAALFRDHPDFPLRIEDFAFSAVGWGSKAAAVRGMAGQFRIAPDAVLMVDDNPGEIASAAGAVPGLRTLLAADPDDAARALTWYPGLVGYGVGAADLVRAADLGAAAERDRIAAEATDTSAYLRSLDVKLTFAVDPVRHRHRLHELSMKTNQFNTSLARLPEAEVGRRIAAEDCRVISVSLADRLSDSGVVASIQTRLASRTLVVDEIAISCRALGRGVEDLIVGISVLKAAAELGACRVRFVAVEGPRNDPGREYADGLLKEAEADEGAVIACLRSRVARVRGQVRVDWEDVS